jgi:hypothetical protein
LGSSPDKLTRLQRELLDAFFQRERGFFLTGGAALAGFYLAHRETSDLDFFTAEGAAFERGLHVLRAAAESVGASLAVRQDAPGFKRLVVSRGDESVVVDLVHDRVPAAYPSKQERGLVRLDPPQEILVNKLTTLVSRSEPRDLVDLFYLERSGLDVEAALPKALEKDGGCTPATLAWLLSEIRIPDGARLPGGVSPAELRSYVADLTARLLRAAAPDSGSRRG